MLYAVIALSLLAAAALAAAGYLHASRRALRAERARLADELASRDQAIEGYLQQIEQLRATVAQRDKTLHEKDIQITRFRGKLEGLDDKFKSLAQEVLNQTNERFFQLANEKFKGEQKSATAALDQRKAAIESLLRPIRESLDKHAKAVTDIEKSREGAYHSLRQQLTSLLEDQKALRGETANLVKALRRPDVRGRWGEMQLRRVAELAGMIDHCDFTEQAAIGNSLRPDMVVHLPADRQIVVDAKTPIDAYLAALEAPDDATREQQFTRFVRHVKDKVDELASKAYQAELPRPIDFVVLFIPGESFLQAALQRDAELLERAFNRGVVIATPSTLIALLKAVAAGWREQQVAENARHIADLGQELHKRIGTAIEHLDRLGKSIDSAVSNYNKLVGSIESSVLPQTRRFEDLGARSQKELPAPGQVKVIETAPRPLKTAEQET